jgi:succinoglycan biosynthesis protein ExoA
MSFTTMSLPRTDGVSFVVPVRNGAPWLAHVVPALLAQEGARPIEVVIVEDGSGDGSADLAARLSAADPRVSVVEGPRRGAAAALNLGIHCAQYPLIAQIDQDVVLEPGWLAALLPALDDHTVAAAQGYYATDAAAPLSARVMSLDLEQRYERIAGDETDHVCTGNTLYRASAVAAIGGFDESLGYGYDNDLSYRLKDAGFRLVIRRGARSRHAWREGLRAYLRQQYGFGYGRIDLVTRHARRVGGDAVSPALMMFHPVVLGMALLVACGEMAIGRPREGLTIAAALVGVLLLERAIAGVRAALRFKDPAALTFPFFHLARDAAWVSAMAVWAVRRLSGRPTRPHHSMRARPERAAPGL